jgi:lambda family phage tail tape measure protein/TP901 family phage tail tape measure protein
MATQSEEILFIMKMRDQMSDVLKKAGVGVEEVAKKAEKTKVGLSEMTKAVAGFASAIAGIATSAGISATMFNVYRDFEDTLNDLSRAANLTAGDTKALGDAIQEISMSSRSTSKELFEIASAAGEVGIRGKKDLQEFVDVMNQLNVASDVKGAEGARSLGEFLKALGEGAGKARGYASVLARMNNDLGVSESKTLGVAKTIAALGGRMGVTGEQAIGLAAAFEATGVRSEQAARTVTGAFSGIQQAINEGGDKLRFLSAVTGIAANDMKKAFAQDAYGVFIKFAGGLVEAQKAGKDMKKQMAELGLSTNEIDMVLGPLVNRMDLLKKAMSGASAEMRGQTTLAGEYEQAMETINAKIAELQNVVTATFQDLSEAVGPIANAILDTLISIAKGFKEAFDGLPESVKPVVSAVIILAPAIIGLVGAFALLAPVIAAALPLLGYVAAGLAGVVAVAGIVYTTMQALGISFEDINRAMTVTGAETATFVQQVQALWKTLVDRVKIEIDRFVQSLLNIPQVFVIILGAAKDFVMGLVQIFSDGLAPIGGLLSSAFTLDFDGMKKSVTDATNFMGSIGDKVTKMGAQVLIDQQNALLDLDKNLPKQRFDTFGQEFAANLRSAVRDGIEATKDQGLYQDLLPAGNDNQKGQGFKPNLGQIFSDEQKKDMEDLIKKHQDYVKGLDAEISETKGLIGVSGLLGRERAVQEALIKAQADAQRQGITLTEQEKQKVVELANAQYNLSQTGRDMASGVKQFMHDYADSTTNFGEAAKSIMGTLTSGIEDLLVNFFTGQEVNVKAFVDQMISEMLRLLVIRPLLNSVFGGITGGLFGGTGGGGLYANGGVFQGGNVIPFAKGGVVGSPTLFPMSRGRTGVMGEAGPEAIMPLERGSDGKLGVKVNGGGMAAPSFATTINVKVEGGSRGAKEDEAMAGKLSKQIAAAVDERVASVIQRMMRPGNALNGLRM